MTWLICLTTSLLVASTALGKPTSPPEEDLKKSALYYDFELSELLQSSNGWMDASASSPLSSTPSVDDVVYGNRVVTTTAGVDGEDSEDLRTLVAQIAASMLSEYNYRTDINPASSEHDLLVQSPTPSSSSLLEQSIIASAVIEPFDLYSSVIVDDSLLLITPELPLTVGLVEDEDVTSSTDEASPPTHYNNRLMMSAFVTAFRPSALLLGANTDRKPTLKPSMASSSRWLTQKSNSILASLYSKVIKSSSAEILPTPSLSRPNPTSSGIKVKRPTSLSSAIIRRPTTRLPLLPTSIGVNRLTSTPPSTSIRPSTQSLISSTSIGMNSVQTILSVPLSSVVIQRRPSVNSSSVVLFQRPLLASSSTSSTPAAAVLQSKRPVDHLLTSSSRVPQLRPSSSALHSSVRPSSSSSAQVNVVHQTVATTTSTTTAAAATTPIFQYHLYSVFPYSYSASPDSTSTSKPESEDRIDLIDKSRTEATEASSSSSSSSSSTTSSTSPSTRGSSFFIINRTTPVTIRLSSSSSSPEAAQSALLTSADSSSSSVPTSSVGPDKDDNDVWNFNDLELVRNNASDDDAVDKIIEGLMNIIRPMKPTNETPIKPQSNPNNPLPVASTTKFPSAPPIFSNDESSGPTITEVPVTKEPESVTAKPMGFYEMIMSGANVNASNYKPTQVVYDFPDSFFNSNSWSSVTRLSSSTMKTSPTSTPTSPLPPPPPPLTTTTTTTMRAPPVRTFPPAPLTTRTSPTPTTTQPLEAVPNVVDGQAAQSVTLVFKDHIQTRPIAVNDQSATDKVQDVTTTTTTSEPPPKPYVRPTLLRPTFSTEKPTPSSSKLPPQFVSFGLAKPILLNTLSSTTTTTTKEPSTMISFSQESFVGSNILKLQGLTTKPTSRRPLITTRQPTTTTTKPIFQLEEDQIPVLLNPVVGGAPTKKPAVASIPIRIVPIVLPPTMPISSPPTTQPSVVFGLEDTEPILMDHFDSESGSSGGVQSVPNIVTSSTHSTILINPTSASSSIVRQTIFQTVVSISSDDMPPHDVHHHDDHHLQPPLVEHVGSSTFHDQDQAAPADVFHGADDGDLSFSVAAADGDADAEKPLTIPPTTPSTTTSTTTTTRKTTTTTTRPPTTTTTTTSKPTTTTTTTRPKKTSTTKTTTAKPKRPTRRTTTRRPFLKYSVRPASTSKPQSAPALSDSASTAVTTKKPTPKPTHSLMSFGLSLLPAAVVATFLGIPLALAVGKKKRRRRRDIYQSSSSSSSESDADLVTDQEWLATQERIAELVRNRFH